MNDIIVFRQTTPLVEVHAVFQVTEDVLALLGQDVVHHVSWNVDILLGVFIILSVGQLKSKDWGKQQRKSEWFSVQLWILD